MYCQQCGTENGPDAAFCISCGSALDHETVLIKSTSLEDALLGTIRILGPQSLSDADQLRSGLSDVCDHSDKEYLVFMRSCDAGFINLFKNALQTRTASDFVQAASMAESYLRDRMVEDATMSRSVSRATANAFATYSGVGRLEWTETKARPADYSPIEYAPAPTPTPSPAPTPAPASYAPYPNLTPAPPANNYNPYPPPADGRKGKSGVGIALGVIIALGIAIAVLFGTGMLSFDESSPASGVVYNYQGESYLNLSKETLPTYWKGWYYGYTAQTASHTTKRACDIQLTSVLDDGSLTGICFVSMHAESVNDIHCSYDVSGSIDWETGRIVLNGTNWVDKGNSEGWGDFEGYVTGGDSVSIVGTWYSASDHSTNGDWYVDAI